MLEWTPSPQSHSSSNAAASTMQPELCSAAAPEKTHSLVALAVAPDADLAARESAMRGLARDVRKTSRYIGLLPFLIYA